MPYSVALHSSPRLAALRFTGRVTPLDVRDACLRLLDFSDWHAGTPQIWDFSSVSEVSADPEAWSSLISTSWSNQARIGANRVAVVSHDPDLDAFFDLYAFSFRESGRTFRLVDCVGEARDWIGAPHEEAGNEEVRNV